MRYVKAPAGWEPDLWVPDGTCAGKWSAFCILDRDDSQVLTGGTDAGLWMARFGRSVGNLPERLGDFLRYEDSQGRTVILSTPHDVDADSLVERALAATVEPCRVRQSDPRLLVHSTTASAWRRIEADGVVKSAARLDADGRPRRAPAGPPTEVEMYLAKEPPEYAGYVMLGAADSPFTELVAASHATGLLSGGLDTPYEPGVRLYFDNHAIIRACLAVRDGLHPMKVRDSLPLAPYLLAAITASGLGGQAEGTSWTPRRFTEAANRQFDERFPG